MDNTFSPQMRQISDRRWSASARQWLRKWGIDQVRVFQIPLTTRFRSVTSRQGILLHGPFGWGECSPFLEYSPTESLQWLLSAARSATEPAPVAVRSFVPVNVTIPVSSPSEAAERAHVAACPTAKIKVADPRSSLQGDIDRVQAVSATLARDFGSAARVRIDVNGAWQRDQACRAIELLEVAAAAVGGLEYVEQPCESVQDLAYVRRRTQVKIAADESIRRADDPFRVVEMEAADLAVIKVAPLGGVGPALRLATELGIPLVVSSAIDTSIGLAAGVALAAALPELPFACGLDTQRLLQTDVTGTVLASVGGNLSVDLAASLSAGQLVADFRDADSFVTNHWIERVEQMIGAAEA